MFELNKTKI